MARVKRGNHRKEKRKKILKQAKGYYGKKSTSYRVAKEAVDRAGNFSYRDRRAKKRDFRRLWIVRINAGARANDITYSRLINGLNVAGCEVNRKMLADLAVHQPEVFAELAQTAKDALASSASS